MSITNVIIKLLQGNNMKKLRQIGNSWGIIIPKNILEMMNINPVLDYIEVELDNKTYKIKKAEKEQ